MKPRNLILIPLLLCTAILGPAATGADLRKKSAYSDSDSDGRISVAVSGIKAAGADPAIANATSAILSAQLAQSPRLVVIEEATLHKILEEQGYQSDACDDAICQVELGKLAGVQKTITGNLSKLGNTYVLGLKVIDVRTGAVEFTTQDKFAGSEDQLINLASAAAGKVRSHFEGGAAAVPAAAAPAASGRIESSDGEYPTDCPPAGKKYFVAVYPIKAAGSDAALAVSMSSLLGTRLTRSSQLNIVEEAMLKAVIERQGLNASDACDDTSCQVSVGKLVKAQKIIMGDLTKFGQKFILSLKLVNVETGVSEFSTEAKCTCSEDDLEMLVDAVVAKVRNHFCEQVPIPASSPPAAYSGPARATELSALAPVSGSAAVYYYYEVKNNFCPNPWVFTVDGQKISVSKNTCVKKRISSGNHTVEFSGKTFPVAATPGGNYYFTDFCKISAPYTGQVSDADAARWASTCQEAP